MSIIHPEKAKELSMKINRYKTACSFIYYALQKNNHSQDSTGYIGIFSILMSHFLVRFSCLLYKDLLRFYEMVEKELNNLFHSAQHVGNIHVYRL